MNQICHNAYGAGLKDDPRTEFDMPIGRCPCYQPKQMLELPDIPKVCGNCEWYSVQEGKQKDLVPA